MSKTQITSLDRSRWNDLFRWHYLAGCDYFVEAGGDQSHADAIRESLNAAPAAGATESMMARINAAGWPSFDEFMAG